MFILKSFIIAAMIFSLCHNTSSLTHQVRNKRTRTSLHPIKGLEDYLEPYLTRGLTKHLAHLEGEKLGHGSTASVYRLEWPGQEHGAIAKFNPRMSLNEHEASFLAYLDRAGGAPRLLHIDPVNGAMVIECVAGKDLVSFSEVPRPLSQWLLILYSLTSQLSEIHSLGVVHGDLKPDNVIVSYDDEGLPTARIIDFGLSTLSGTRSAFVGEYADWKKNVASRGWYSAEFFKGEVLDVRADIVGLAYTMKEILPDMKSHSSNLFTLTEWAMSYDKEERPSLAQFSAVLWYEYQRWK